MSNPVKIGDFNKEQLNLEMFLLEIGFNWVWYLNLVNK